MSNFILHILKIAWWMKAISRAKIGGSEGEVKEIMLNYVKYISHLHDHRDSKSSYAQQHSASLYKWRYYRLLFSDVLSRQGLWGKLGILNELFKKIVEPEPVIEEFWVKYRKVLPRKPEFSVFDVSFLNRTLKIGYFSLKGKQSFKSIYSLNYRRWFLNN